MNFNYRKGHIYRHSWTEKVRYKLTIESRKPAKVINKIKLSDI